MVPYGAMGQLLWQGPSVKARQDGKGGDSWQKPRTGERVTTADFISISIPNGAVVVTSGAAGAHLRAKVFSDGALVIDGLGF